MLEIRTTGLAWRDLFILVGNPHHMLKFSTGTWRLAAMGSKQDPEANAGWRQNHPLAYGEMVWELCEVLNLDPMLIFALMRQESTYHPTIVSPAGAIGVMQIMPGTGAKVAALSGYFPYHPDGLTDPATNVYFGIWYLSRLNARYDGQFPLAIGSYNGGPHNIGRWLRSKHGIGLEEFVEEVPFNETRGYIKKVVRNYATYLAIYDPDAYVQLPRTTRADDPTVINF
jgi:peptidoglycan lytic transglycosylase